MRHLNVELLSRGTVNGPLSGGYPIVVLSALRRPHSSFPAPTQSVCVCFISSIRFVLVVFYKLIIIFLVACYESFLTLMLRLPVVLNDFSI